MKRTLAALAAMALVATVSASTLPATSSSSSQSTFKLTSAPAAVKMAMGYAVENVLTGVMQKAKWFEPAGEKQPLQAKSPATLVDTITTYGYGAGLAVMLKAKEVPAIKVVKAGQFQPGGKYVEGALTAVGIIGGPNQDMIGAS